MKHSDEPRTPKKQSGSSSSEERRRERGCFRGSLRLPPGKDADALRALMKEHGGIVGAIRWLLRAAGVV